MHLLASSPVIRNEQQSGAENGEISPLFLRFLGYEVGGGSALNGLPPSTTLLADVLMSLLSVNITYCTLIPSLNPFLTTLQDNIHDWLMESTPPQAAATAAWSWAGWRWLSTSVCLRDALYPVPSLPAPCSHLSPFHHPWNPFYLNTENNPREQMQLKSTLSIENQKKKLK